MAKEGMIRWKQGDYVRLGKAVADFNKKVKSLDSEMGQLGLPDLVNYQELKSNIVTRKELNRQIEALRSFKETGQEAITTATQEPMTEWEYKQLSQMRDVAVKRAETELATLNEPVKGSGGYSLAQMGSSRATSLRGSIESMKKLETATKWKFQDIKNRITYFGTADASMKHAIIFRENYIREMQKYSGFKRYNELMNYLYSIKNPLDFYDTLNGTNELISDLFYQSNQTYSEEEFSAFVSEVLGRKATGSMKERREKLEDDYYAEKNRQDISASHSDISSLSKSNLSDEERRAGFRGFRKM